MKNYDFASPESIDEMYEAVCTESIAICKLAFDLNRHYIDEPLSATELKQSIWQHISIKISVGSHMIEVPNNADNVEALFGYVHECANNTI